jgi:RND family efflux transporter MFP subunit
MNHPCQASLGVEELSTQMNAEEVRRVDKALAKVPGGAYGEQSRRIHQALAWRSVGLRIRSAYPSDKKRSLGLSLSLLLLLGIPVLAAAAEPDVGASAATGTNLIALEPAQQQAFGIVLTAPTSAGESLTRRYPARVTVPNRQQRVVSAPQAGILSALLVAEGEQVAANQILAEMRSPELVEAQSRFLEGVTRLALVETELKRDEMLHREGVIAERRLLETQAKQRELLTQVDQGRQLLGLAGLSPTAIDQLARTRKLSSTLPILAPIAGVVLEQLVSTGQSVAAATPLYRVAQLKPLWLEIHVPVDRVGGLAEGGRVLLPGLGTEGAIIAVGRMVHAEDQGVLVRAAVTEGTEQLRPGQFVEVQLASVAPETGWRVPAAAVVRNAGAAYLFVARPGGFVAMPIQVLAEEEQNAVVAGSLGLQDQVAVSGVIALKAAWLGAAQ